MNIVFYTCATGPEDGFIPSIAEELPEGISCYFLHDSFLKDQATETKGWNYINLDDQIDCPQSFNLKQRFGKTLSHRWFPDADVTIYSDNKWYFSRAFFDFLINVVKNIEVDCVVAEHPDNRSFIEEVMWGFTRGTLSFDMSLHVANKLKSYGCDLNAFESALCTFLIRKNTEKVAEANSLWYRMLLDTFTDRLRDQPFFCYTGMPFSRLSGFMELMTEQLECFFLYPPHSRAAGQIEIARKDELIAAIKDVMEK